METPNLETLLTNLHTVLVAALTAEGPARRLKADAVTTVINGQLGPYLAAQERAIAALTAQVAALKT